MTKRRISIDKITPDPGQPRKAFDDDTLNELAQSIKANGLIQPISVRPTTGGRYIIIAGERRWRAHCLLRDRGHAKFAMVEAIVRKNEHLVDVRVKQLVENIQRDDMPILEEADALAALRDEFGLEPDEIAQRLGLAPFRVRWRLQLLQLAPEIRRLVAGEHLDKQQAMEVARLDRHVDQRRIVQMINRRELVGWKAVRSAVDAILEKTTVADLFGDTAPARAEQLETVRRMERKVEQIVGMVAHGWRDGECVVATLVSPDRADHMADQLATIKAAISTMERELRNAAGQAKIALAG
jgi:ParB family chromosome partitioning protein